MIASVGSKGTSACTYGWTKSNLMLSSDKTRFELLSIFGKRISEKRDSWLHGRKNSKVEVEKDPFQSTVIMQCL